MSKEWHENIPENGVLCKKDNDTVVRIVASNNFDAWTDNSEFIALEYLTPLTTAEFWYFAPWQGMDSAPSDGSLMLILDNSDWHIGYYDAENECFTSCEFNLLNPKKWLPLPTGHK